MFVTDIKEYKKGKSEIFLNDESAFVLYNSEVKKLDLNKGIEIDDEYIRFIKESILIPRAKKRAMNLLLKNDRTEADLFSKLKDSRYPLDVCNEALMYVKSFKYVDDERYARNFVSSRSRTNSRVIIRGKLLNKGIPKETADKVLEEFYSDTDNSEDVIKLIKKKIIKKYMADTEPDYETKNRIYASLVRKGFEYRDIDRAYGEIREGNLVY